ncbi:LptA/OstA family protein [Bradyrhizobium sp. Tv2a-2]|uniref:LptA/OstA family protein n=1 Tax=Bradyrhizobium sp. Tv2a-2 TaxID=113395 RepID=UPI00046407A0|nr:LptA/OstA family protein [Bradyrhizobium sp. Tv2a-2]
MSMPFLPRLCGPSGQLTAIAFAISFGAAFGASAQSSVQGVPNAMQGFSQNRDQPIQIEAASLEMRDKKKEATFSGNVKVVQGDTTMTSKTLVVFYESSGQGQGQGQAQGQQPAPAPAKGAKAAPPPGAPMQSAAPGPGGSSSIKRLEAHGNVVVTQKDQVVTGETAVFDTKSNLITMLGGVVLTQCKNVLRGDRLFVDMTTGVSRVESDSGKVQGLFINQGGGGCEGAGPGPGPTQSPAPAGAKPGAGSPLSILNQNKPK